VHSKPSVEAESNTWDFWGWKAKEVISSECAEVETCVGAAALRTSLQLSRSIVTLHARVYH